MNTVNFDDLGKLERALAQRDALVVALKVFVANEVAMEEILWRGFDDDELMTISVRLGAYKKARDALRSVVGTGKEP